jgi:hypothetical protein
MTVTRDKNCLAPYPIFPQSSPPLRRPRTDDERVCVHACSCLGSYARIARITSSSVSCFVPRTANCQCCVFPEASASGWSLVQRSPTECGVSECDREASIMRRPGPLVAVVPQGRKKFHRCLQTFRRRLLPQSSG